MPTFRRAFRLGSPIVAVLLLAASGARAQTGSGTIESIVRDFGLMGTWSVDCRAPASGAVPRSTYTVKDGAVWRLLDFGDGSHGYDYTVSDAHLLAPDRLAFRVQGASEQFDLVIQMRDGRAQTLLSVDKSGKVWIDKGILVSSGKPAPMQEKCDK